MTRKDRGWQILSQVTRRAPCLVLARKKAPPGVAHSIPFVRAEEGAACALSKSAPGVESASRQLPVATLPTGPGVAQPIDLRDAARRLRPAAAEADPLRRVWSIVVQGHGTGAGAFRGRRELHADRATGPRRHRTAAGPQPAKSKVAADQKAAAERQRGVPRVGERDKLDRARFAHRLIAKAQRAR